MTASRFQIINGEFVPDATSHAPWSTDMLHGRLIGGLAARAVEQAITDKGRRVARLTVDLFRPAGMGPVSVETIPVRSGRRIQVIDVVLSSGGHQVARATALVLGQSEEPPGSIWQPERSSWPDPEAGEASARLQSHAENGWNFIEVAGGFGSGKQTRMWTNDDRQLVAGEDLSPFVRAALSGDLACPIANSSDDGLHYINADYTLVLGRYPVGPWIGLEVNQHIAADGISLGSSTLVDRLGPFGTSTGSSITRPPLK